MLAVYRQDCSAALDCFIDYRVCADDAFFIGEGNCFFGVERAYERCCSAKAAYAVYDDIDIIQCSDKLCGIAAREKLCSARVYEMRRVRVGDTDVFWRKLGYLLVQKLGIAACGKREAMKALIMTYNVERLSTYRAR